MTSRERLQLFNLPGVLQRLKLLLSPDPISTLRRRLKVQIGLTHAAWEEIECSQVSEERGGAIVRSHKEVFAADLRQNISF